MWKVSKCGDDSIFTAQGSGKRTRYSADVLSQHLTMYTAYIVSCVADNHVINRM